MSKSDQSSQSGKRPAFIHDKFFKNVFSNADYVTSLIKIGAPDEMFDIIDWSTLSLRPTSLIDRKLGEKFADLVFAVNVKDNPQPAQVILHFEHKSYSDNNLLLQVAENQFRLYLQEKFQSLIIPIVVAQYAGRNTGPMHFLDLFSNLSARHRQVFSLYSVNFRCLVIDINAIDRLGLAEQTSINAVVHAMSNVHSAKSSILSEILSRMSHVKPEEKPHLLSLMFDYVSGYNKRITIDDLYNMKTETSEETHMILSAADMLRQEGRQEELLESQQKVEGIATYLLQKGIDIETVMEATQLDRSKIKSLHSKSAMDS